MTFDEKTLRSVIAEVIKEMAGSGAMPAAAAAPAPAAAPALTAPQYADNVPIPAFI